MLKFLACTKMMQIKLFQERNKIAQLGETRKSAMHQIQEKIMSVMLSRCYKTLKGDTAKAFINMISNNKTDMDISSYVPVNMKYYEDVNADLTLTKEEILVSKLLNAVIIIIIIILNKNEIDRGRIGTYQTSQRGTSRLPSGETFFLGTIG